MSKTISAISTAPGVGGVAIIRVSGKDSLGIAEKMFRPLGKTAVKDFEPYKMYVGEINGGTFTDFGMCVFFKSPRSYTGEDMIEFHCHGGVAITQGVLRQTFELGAVPATRGEFTKTAFLNGKMSLSSCEGLIDMINSESVGEVKAGYYLYREKLCKKISDLQGKLTYALAFINAGIDYPEEGVTEDNYDSIIDSLNYVKNEVSELLGKYGEGRKIKNGVKVSISGKPNTGKSSLLNRLLDYEKAIVSSVAGTTRDVVEGEIDIDGVKFLFSDTAGIRESGDEIESVGIERSFKILNSADVCLVVLDGSGELDDDDKRILSDTENRERIVVVNKIDLERRSGVKGDVYVSAKSGAGIDELKRMLIEKVFGGKVDLSADFLTEERHYVALKEAYAAIIDAIDGFSVNTADLSAIDIHNAWTSLGKISGETADETIIGEIFGKFCVGK